MTKLVLDREQNAVLSEALSEARNMKASPREEKALVEALIVESNIRNLPGGDRDSRGPLQQRTSQGWKHPRNVRLAVRDFITAARKNNSGGGSSGKLAQSVQRSGFPTRYDEHSAEADYLLRNNGSSISTPSRNSTSGSNTRIERSATMSRVDPEAVKRVALAQHLQRSNPDSMLLRLGVVDPSEPTSRLVSAAGDRRSLSAPQEQSTSKLSTPGAQLTGVANFEGMKVAAWIKPALVYARHHGWKGQVTSGFRSLADQTRIYNSGVRPAAKPGTSNHEATQFPRGAVDVSDPAVLSKILAQSPYAKQLQWAGSKDPVHFSHPHGGSY